MKIKRLLILGPSYKRRSEEKPIPALERYDGLYFRTARKHLLKSKGVDVVVMLDNLCLVNGSTPVLFTQSQGDSWTSMRHFKPHPSKEVNKTNAEFLRQKLRNSKYEEVFLSMGKEYAAALPEMSQFRVPVVFPTSGGLGTKARALKDWLTKGIWV
jgi:hypothetical protein